MNRRGALPGWLHSRYAAALGVGVAGVVLAAAAGFLAYERREIETNAMQQTQLFARVLEDQANRTLNGVELALGAVGDSLGGPPAAGTAAGSGSSQSPVLQQSLQALPFLRSLSVLDAQGRVLASSNQDNLGRHVVRARLGSPRGGLGPLLNGRDLASLADDDAAGGRSASGHLLPLVRPLADGRLLVAAINADYFANQYPLMLGDEPLQAAMFTYDGTLVAGSDGVRLSAGQRLLGHPVFVDWLPGRERGQLQATGLDGQPALLAFRSARSHPLVLMVATPVQVVQAEFAQVVRFVGAAAAAVLAVLAALITLAWRSLRSHERAQQDLAAARDTLAAQDAFTDRLFQVSPVPMVVKDLRGRFMRVNRAWSDFTGISPDQAVGRSLGQLYPPVLAAPHEVQEQMALSAQQPASYEEQVLDRDGLPRDVMIRVVPYTDQDGQVAGVISCLMDVTEFREAEIRTTEAKDAAERANTAKTEFLANISHELRTPLQIILGFSELGKVRARQDPRVQEMFTDVHNAGERMLALVNNLLDLSRIDSSVGEVHLAAQDIAPLLGAVVHELRQLASQRGLRLLAPASSPPLWALADGARLQQVLRNVLANAIRFAPEGSEVALDWRRDPVAGDLQVQVRDHGPGIPEPELESVFEAFVQSTRTKDGAGGTGLGLAICRKIMAAHHGSITARNAPGGGALFELRLPGTTQRPD